MNVVQTTPFGTLVQSRGQVNYRESTAADASKALASPLTGASLLAPSHSGAAETPVAPKQNAVGVADKASDSAKVRTSKALLDLYA